MTIISMISYLQFTISGQGSVNIGEQTADEIISEVDWDNMGDSE